MPTASKKPKLSASERAFLRQAACAVLSGIYAAHGCDIMEAEKAERALAIRTAARIALTQAAELVRREAEMQA
jgi:hypothetical protein